MMVIGVCDPQVLQLCNEAIDRKGYSFWVLCYVHRYCINVAALKLHYTTFGRKLRIANALNYLLKMYVQDCSW